MRYTNAMRSIDQTEDTTSLTDVCEKAEHYNNMPDIDIGRKVKDKWMVIEIVDG